jgi:hypothetical protein
MPGKGKITEDLDVSSSTTKQAKSVKKAHRLCDVTFVVIDDILVKDLKIDENTFFTQEKTTEGILLRRGSSDIKQHDRKSE